MPRMAGCQRQTQHNITLFVPSTARLTRPSSFFSSVQIKAACQLNQLLAHFFSRDGDINNAAGNGALRHVGIARA